MTTRRVVDAVNTLRALRRTQRGAVADAWANRRSFWVQVLVMVVNDMMWVLFWVIFFRQLGELRGWELGDVLVLHAVLTAAGGVVLGLFNNTRRLAGLISAGGLDDALVQPVPTLPYLLVRRIEPVNLGDLLFGIGLFIAAGNHSIGRTVAFVVAVLAGSLVLGSFLVLAGCTAFIGGRSDTGELGFHSIVLFASYPVDVFTGVMRVVLYTAIPAAFVSALPSRAVVEVEPLPLIACFGVGLGLAATAALAFRVGLKRYTSGAIWTAA